MPFAIQYETFQIGRQKHSAPGNFRLRKQRFPLDTPIKGNEIITYKPQVNP